MDHQVLTRPPLSLQLSFEALFSLVTRLIKKRFKPLPLSLSCHFASLYSSKWSKYPLDLLFTGIRSRLSQVYQGKIRCFANCSKTEVGIGAVFRAYENYEHIYFRRGRLTIENLVFQKELFVIKNFLLHLIHFNIFILL